MKKILIGYVTSNFSSGINKYIESFTSITQNENIQLDFLTREDVSKDPNKVYKISRNRKPLKQLIQMIKIKKKKKYDIAYFNISETFDCIGIIAAKLCGVKKIIAHSHSSGEESKSKIIKKIKVTLNTICKPIISLCCNSYLACSTNAAEWLYSKFIIENKEYEIVYNSVDDEKFKFNENARDSIRRELNIKDKYVIGHVSRFCKAKNQKFLLEILKDVFEKNNNAVGLLVGEGNTFEEIKEYAKQLNIEDKIIFTGKKQNVEEYMSAFDIFLLPSKYEGLPIVGIEAQFSGLPCLFSDKITEELIIAEKSKRLSIDNAQKWAEEILKTQKRENKLTEKAKDFQIKNSNEQFNKIVNEEHIIKEKKKSSNSLGLWLKIFLVIHYILNLTCYLNGLKLLLIPSAILMAGIVFFNVKNFNKVIKNKIYIFFMAFLLSYLTTFLINNKYNVTGSIKVLIWTTMHFVFSFGCYYITSDYQLKKELKYVSTVLILVLSILNINNLLLLITHTSSFTYSLSNVALLVGLTPWGRFYGIFYDPNYTSIMCVVSMFLAIYLLKEYKSKFIKILLIFSIVLQVIYIVFCESRSGLFTLITTIAVYSALNMIVIKNLKKNIKIFLITITTIILVIVLPKICINCYNNIQNKKEIKTEEVLEENPKTKIQIGRNDNQEDVSNRRFDIWKSGLEIFSKNLIFGVGFPNITPIALDKYPSTYIVNNDFSHFDAFHNSVIDVFTSQGIIGGTIMAMIYLYTLIETIKRRKILFNKNNKNTREIIIIITCMFSIMISSMLLSQIYYINNACTFMFWALFGYYNYYLKSEERNFENEK